jgi:quercetin dioxygenase-like cupin family protein
MTPDDRSRTHPHERLSGAMHHVNLVDALAGLRAEAHPGTHGHRQLAIVRHGALSIVLFAFESDGRIKEHQTNGEVTIQVLSGAIEVTIGTGPVVIRAGEILALEPGQPHAVRALETSDMLLTVCRHVGA